MVTGIVAGPRWFFGIDSVLEAVSMLICLTIFVFSLKLYRITKERRHLYFSAAFGLLTLAFFVRSITNLVIHFRTVSDWGMKHLPQMVVAKGILSVTKIFLLGYTIHIALTLMALALLVVLCLKIEDKKPYFLMLMMMSVLIYLSNSYFTSFYLLSLILLGFITCYYFQNFWTKRKAATLLTFIAFLLYTFAPLAFLFQKMFGLGYAVAYILQFSGFLTMLAALLVVIFKK